MTDAKSSAPIVPAASNFIRELIAADVAAKKHGGRVATRFPPEPNGYLHIGHAKSICLNFGTAREFGGTTNLRFDDTNPTTESEEYAQSIMDAVKWLGFTWSGEVRHASDYFEQLYAWAVQLIQQGDAYVCSLTEAQMREMRGTVTETGTVSPYASRGVEENLALFARMKAGEFPDGAHTLRARIDMANANMKMRDPPLYRIRKAHHYRRGDSWTIYPLYDYAHCLSDAIEEITHSICTLEFENNRELYDWLIAKVGIKDPPHQYEFARLNLTYTVMSKRKLLALVQDGRVSGWDDPRLPTIVGMRRRGVTAKALRAFCEEIGVAKTNSIIDVQRLEAAIRDDLEPNTPRAMAVLNPLRVVIENYPEGQEELLEAPKWPEAAERTPGRVTQERRDHRQLPFSRELFIERDDFAESPPKGWRRLAVGTEIRLRSAYFMTCKEVVRDAHGNIQELRCTYDPKTRGGESPDGRKVKGTLHWVSAKHALPATVRLYDHLFTVEQPDAVPEGTDWRDNLNPQSLVTISNAWLEPSLGGAKPGDAFQFERLGFFVADRESDLKRLVFNRTVALKDTFTKKALADDKGSEAKVAGKPAAIEKPAVPKRDLAAAFEERIGKLLPELRAAMQTLEQRGLSREDALALSTDDAGRKLFDEALAAHPSPKSVSRLVVSELPRAMKELAPNGLAVSGRALGELAALVDGGALTGTSAREVLEEMVRSGRGPAAIVEAKGLRAVAGEEALIPIVDEVLAKHADELARYRAGNKNLLGFFVGAVVRAAGGQADAKSVRELLLTRLA